MTGNYFVCGNEVFVEGKSIGQFVSVSTNEDRRTIVNTCTVVLPIYAIGVNIDEASDSKVRALLEGVEIKSGANIEIQAWYHNNELLEQEFDKITVFKGFIRQVIGGFPATLICEDYAFLLRFGTINKDWKSRTAIKDMIEFLLPISNDAFKKYREKQEFESAGDYPTLSFDPSSVSGDFALKTFKQISPYDALSKLLKLYALYGHVNDEGKVYVGIGIDDIKKETIELSTQTNVIGRNINPTSGLFQSYQVTVNGMLDDGSKYTYKYGDDYGEHQQIFSPLRTEEGIQQTAKNVMASLKENRNKGTITTKLYPQIKLFDYIKYEDTLLKDLSGGYYVIGHKYTLNENGYNQVCTVTNETFML